MNVFAQVPTNGLIASYPFSGNANDATGNGHNGTVTGATLTTDRFGNANSAYLFNGTNNYISVPTFSMSAFTVSGWIYTNGVNTSNLNGIISNLGTSAYMGGFIFVNRSNDTLNKTPCFYFALVELPKMDSIMLTDFTQEGVLFTHMIPNYRLKTVKLGVFAYMWK